MNRKNDIEDQINRYMYQVSRYLFCKNKEDIEKEIRSMIDDMLEAKCAGNEPTLDDIASVFAEIGKPRELASQYVDSKNYLIGPLLYPIYLHVLKIVLFISLIASLVINFIALVSGTYTQDTFGVIIDAALSSFATVTIIFVIIERKGIHTDKSMASDYVLPPVPKNKNRIPVSSPIVSIIFGFIFISLFAFTPEVFGIVTSNTDGIIPVFAVDVISSALPFIIIFLCVGMVKSLFELIEGRYTVKLLLQTVLCNVASGLLALYILTNFSIWNPKFSEKLMMALDDMDIQVYMMGNGQTMSSVLLAIILFGLALDTLVCAAKTISKEK